MQGGIRIDFGPGDSVRPRLERHHLEERQHGLGEVPEEDADEVGGSAAYMLGLTQLSNYLTWKGSFSALSKPNFASKYPLESS